VNDNAEAKEGVAAEYSASLLHSIYGSIQVNSVHNSIKEIISALIL